MVNEIGILWAKTSENRYFGCGNTNSQQTCRRNCLRSTFSCSFINFDDDIVAKVDYTFVKNRPFVCQIILEEAWYGGAFFQRSYYLLLLSGINHLKYQIGLAGDNNCSQKQTSKIFWKKKTWVKFINIEGLFRKFFWCSYQGGNEKWKILTQA